MNVNPWSSTFIMDTCRVCWKQFCCKKHLASHEMEEHKRLASSVQTLPEICQKCSTFVSNINDLNSECAQLTNRRYNVLNEHSPNITVDRPRKRTYSMMNIVKSPMLNLEQDCLIKRPKTQARKRIGPSRKIFEKAELEVVKKDSQETSPKFEEIKSSSTPIKRDQQDLRVKLLKSKLEPPKVQKSTTNLDLKLLSPSSQKENFSCRKIGTPFEKSCDHIPEDEIEKSMYGTPGSKNFTPFIKGKKCDAHWRKGDSANTSIYGTPESSLISTNTSTVIKGWPDDQELIVSNSRPNLQIFTESEEEKLKDASKLLCEKTKSSENNINKEAEKISISLLELDNKLLIPLSNGLSCDSKMMEINESEINIEAVTVDGKLYISCENSEENLCIKKKIQILSGPQVNNYEEKIVDPPTTAFFNSPTKTEIAGSHSYDQRRIKDSAHTVPLNTPNLEKNFTGYSKKIPDLNSSDTEIPLRIESPPDFQQRHGGDDKRLISEESTPDSITEEIVGSQFLNNNCFYFESISCVQEDNTDELPKFGKEVNPFNSSSTEVTNVSCIHKLAPATTSYKNTTELDSLDLESSPKSSVRVELPGKNISAGIEYLQVNQIKSPQENQTTTIYDSDDCLNDLFYTPFKENPGHRSSAPQSFMNSNSKRNVHTSSSDTSIHDWKSFNLTDKGSQESLIQSPNNSDNQGVLINIGNISSTFKQSHATVHREKNHILYGCDPDNFEASLSEDVSNLPASLNTKVEKNRHNCHSFEGNTTSQGDVSCKDSVSYVPASTKKKDSPHQESDNPSEASLLKDGNRCIKNQSLEKNNLSSHCLRSSDISSFDLNREVIMTKATCSNSFPMTETQKENLNTYEEGCFSSFEGNTTSQGDVSCKDSVSYVPASTKKKDSPHQESDNPSEASLLKDGNRCIKNQSLEKNNLSSHCLRSSDISSYNLNREVIMTKATCSNSFPMTETQKENLNTYEEGRFSSFEGNTTSQGDVSCKDSVSYVPASTKKKDSLHQESDNPSEASLLKDGNRCIKNQSLEKNNLSSHCLRSSDISSYDLNREVIMTKATCSNSFPMTETQKENLNTYEEGRFSSFEDSFFKIVASTPMVRPKKLTSASLDEDSINSTKNSLRGSTSKNGLFSLAKNRVKSYFPYFFKEKTHKSKSTEDLHSSSFQVENFQSPDTTLQISQVQGMDKTISESANLTTINQKLLKRRPLWSWPKRRRPIHENRTRVTEDTFSNAERIS